MKKKMTNTFIACAIVLIAFAAAFITNANACSDCKVNAAAFTEILRKDCHKPLFKK